MLNSALYYILWGLKGSLLIIVFTLIVLIVEAAIGANGIGIKVTILSSIVVLVAVNFVLIIISIPIILCIIIINERNYLSKKIINFFKNNVDLDKFNRNTKIITITSIIFLVLSCMLWIWGKNMWIILLGFLYQLEF